MIVIDEIESASNEGWGYLSGRIRGGSASRAGLVPLARSRMPDPRRCPPARGLTHCFATRRRHPPRGRRFASTARESASDPGPLPCRGSPPVAHRREDGYRTNDAGAGGGREQVQSSPPVSTPTTPTFDTSRRLRHWSSLTNSTCGCTRRVFEIEWPRASRLPGRASAGRWSRWKPTCGISSIASATAGA